MLTDEERKEINEAITHYEYKRAACIDAMKILQRHRSGWISDESIEDLADFLGMTKHEIENVATYYSMIYRKPVGRHIILVCDGFSCWALGYDNIIAHLISRLGIGLSETTPDGRFTLLHMPCIGACDHSPAMIIDEDLHGDLDNAKIDEILKEYR